jgi:hypothetical protein
MSTQFIGAAKKAAYDSQHKIALPVCGMNASQKG